VVVIKQLTLFGSIREERKSKAASLREGLIARCFYYKEGQCYYLRSAPSSCNTLCWNWKTTGPNGLVDLYTLISRDPRWKKTIFPSGSVVQETIKEE